MNTVVLDRDKLKNYKLKVTALTPLHLGTGEVYEPTNYIINQNKLFSFNEVLFYKSLSAEDKGLFDKKLNDYMQIIDFYKSKKEEAKKISHFECSVSNEVQSAYERQKNKDGTPNKNQLEIQVTFKNPNTYRPIIPGSSLKGMFDTALQIYSPKIKENDERQNLIVSDALLLFGGVEIGIADRKHKNPDKTSKDGIYQRIEVVQPNSTFIMSINSKFSFEDFKKAFARYHSERKDSRFADTEKSFVARIGKNEGKAYMVDDGKNVLNKDNKPVATHFLYSSNTLSDEQFGWIKIELINDEEYLESLDNIALQEKNHHDNIKHKQKELIEKIEKSKEEEAKALKQKEEVRIKAQREEQEKIIAEAQKLAQMSPLERKIAELESIAPMPKTTLLLKNLQNGVLEEFKSETLVLLKKLMIENKEWKEQPTGKNPAKDKEYQKTLEVKKLLDVI